MIVLLRRPGSAWLDRVASATRSEVHVLDLDAPMHARALTISPERVLWQGFDLTRARTVVLECPWFAWPQANVSVLAAKERLGGEREARALALSALHVASRHARVVQPLRAGFYATSPLAALDACAAHEVRVRPWTAVASRPTSHDGIWLDWVGRDAWTDPCTPAVGEPAWQPRPFDGPVTSVLAIGDSVVGARRFEDARAWSERRSAEVCARVDHAARELAFRARRALDVEWLQVDLLESADGAEVLSVDVGPDLAAWDDDLNGAAATTLAQLLTREIAPR